MQQDYLAIGHFIGLADQAILKNKEYVYNRVIQIFNDAFLEGTQIIAFPEVIGSRRILEGI